MQEICQGISNAPIQLGKNLNWLFRGGNCEEGYFFCTGSEFPQTGHTFSVDLIIRLALHLVLGAFGGVEFDLFDFVNHAD